MWCSFLSAAERRAARHRWEPRRPGASTGGMIDMTRTADLLMRGKFFALTTTMCLWGAQVMAADRLTTPFGDEHDLAGVGVGSEGEIGMAAPIRGVVNGHACERREVGLGEGEIDIAAANGVHPMPAFTPMRATAANGICWASINTSASNSKVKPASLPTQSGSMSATLPSRNRRRGTRTSRWQSCWKKLRWRSRYVLGIVDWVLARRLGVGYGGAASEGGGDSQIRTAFSVRAN
jgi:hypothetical protein